MDLSSIHRPRSSAEYQGTRETLFSDDEAYEMQAGAHNEHLELQHDDEVEDMPTEVKRNPMRIAGSGFRAVALRASNYIEEWTPWAMLISYFAYSIFFYVVLPRAATKVFWYFYLSLSFAVSTAVTMEASHCITPSKDARRAIRRLRETGHFPTPDEKLPTLDLVIVAYLPNEKDIIKKQIRYALREIVYPKEKITINVVYNTPKPIEPLETELQELTQSYANLKVIKVIQSTSKADNLNYFLTNEGRSDIIGIYDTDHYPHPHGPRWAAERFCRGDGTDIVQGRCVVYNYDESWVTKLISAEFDMIYAVFHPGRAHAQGFGLFGGANGYWRSSLTERTQDARSHAHRRH